MAHLANVVLVTVEQIAEAMRAAGVDPGEPTRAMVRAARTLGVRGQDGLLHRAARSLKGARAEDRREPGWCRRREAAELLGVSVKRVDQLRAQARLESRRHPYTGHVWVTLASVAAERTRREQTP